MEIVIVRVSTCAQPLDHFSEAVKHLRAHVLTLTKVLGLDSGWNRDSTGIQRLPGGTSHLVEAQGRLHSLLGSAS